MRVARSSVEPRFGAERLITEYGYDVFFTIAVACCVVVAGSFLLIPNIYLKYSLISLAVGIFIFTLNFFRDPDRKTPSLANAVISPADGTVVVVKDVTEDLYMNESAIQISIFMSPLNVHVNRIPM